MNKPELVKQINHPRPATVYERLAGQPVFSAAAILLVLIIIFFWEMLFTNKLPFMRDFFFDFVPQHRFAGELIRNGQFPFWNPYSGFGKPFAADPITATFYPLHAAFYWFSPAWAVRFYCLSHLWIGGVGLFFLARQWRFEVGPSLFVAIAAMFSSWT